MRLSKFKIEFLSDKILKLIQEHPQIHINSNSDLITRAADDALYENMKAEEDIDREVDGLLEQNLNEIRAEEMDVGALRNKIKRELARKKKFVL